jgi:hypothetical protein
MKTYSNKNKIAAVLVPAALLFGIVAPAFAAEISGSTGVSLGEMKSSTEDAGMKATLSMKAAAKLSALEVKANARAATEIGKRIADLTLVSTRINSMTHVSDATKASLSATIQSSIASLTALKAKIAADTTTADIKADMQSITGAYRIYALVLPQVRILAAADHAGTVADMIAAMNTKMQARIDAAKASGKDVTTIVTAQTDLALKLADVKLQSSTAVTAVSTLTPDNGDKTKMEANTAALKRARADLAVAENELKAAHKDIKVMVSGFKALGIEASVKTTTSAETHSVSHQ